MRAEAGNGAVFMAGGIDLVNRMKFGEPVAEVIYLGSIAGLDAIAETEGALRLGSLVTHYQLETSGIVRKRFPALAESWQDVANIRIRYKGTIGGNVMTADPAYDFTLAAMATGAELHSRHGRHCPNRLGDRYERCAAGRAPYRDHLADGSPAPTCLRSLAAPSGDLGARTRSR